MLKPTTPRLEALMYLRDVVIPWMKANPARVYLDTVYEKHTCGTYACLGGWYALMRYPTCKNEKYSFQTINNITTILRNDFFADKLDWEWGCSDRIFGMEDTGDLDDRLAVVEAEIEQELARVTR